MAGYSNINMNSRYNTSSAYAYETSPRVYPEPVRKPRVKKKKLKQKRIVYMKAENPRASLSISVYIFIGILFLCAGVIVFSMALLSNQKIKVSGLENSLIKEKTRTKQLETETYQVLDFDEIEDIARNKLNMSEPGMHQIRYINVPKESYSVHYEENIVEEDFNWYDKIANVFLSLFNK